jgi:hypothetical protein
VTTQGESYVLAWQSSVTIPTEWLVALLFTSLVISSFQSVFLFRMLPLFHVLGGRLGLVALLLLVV